MVLEKNKREKGKDVANISKSKENDEKVKPRAKRWKKKLQMKASKAKLVEESLQNQAKIEENNKATTLDDRENMVFEKNNKKKGEDVANTSKSNQNDVKVKLRAKRLRKKLRKKASNAKLIEESSQNQVEIVEKDKGTTRQNNKQSSKEGEIKESSTKKIKRSNESGSKNEKPGVSFRKDKMRKVSNKKGTQKAEVSTEGKKLGGLIFMCNSKTKPDCFRYKIMALPSGKKETVLGIKFGLKLFLYDYDLRLLYGIYEAASPGGMKLEPAAFGGSFPAQVRFRIFEDCSPLPESVFKTAIQESYDEKTRKFKMELTLEQVRKLCSLFRPLPPLHSKDHFSVQHLPSYSNARYLTEEEYRKHGLRPEMHGLKPHATLHVPTQEATYRGSTLHVPTQEAPYRGKQEEQMMRSPALTLKAPPPAQAQNLMNPVSIYRNTPSVHDHVFRNPAPVRDHIGGPQPHFLGEEEYRAYGLRGFIEQLPLVSTLTRHEDELNHYQEDQYHPPNYHAISRLGTTGNEPYFQLYQSDIKPLDHGIDYNLLRRVDGDVPYSTYASRELSEYSQTNHNFGSLSVWESAPVSSRYSFAGASYSLTRNQL